MKGQKEAVVEQVLIELPSFQLHKDNAILLLSNIQLETIKANITNAIGGGLVEYSKDINNYNEVRTYARSMVMNHLKKAKELNGGHTYVSGTSSSGNTTDGGNVRTGLIRVKAKLAPKGVNPDLLPDDLKEYVKTLV